MEVLLLILALLAPTLLARLIVACLRHRADAYSITRPPDEETAA